MTANYYWKKCKKKYKRITADWLLNLRAERQPSCLIDDLKLLLTFNTSIKGRVGHANPMKPMSDSARISYPQSCASAVKIFRRLCAAQEAQITPHNCCSHTAAGPVEAWAQTQAMRVQHPCKQHFSSEDKFRLFVKQLLLLSLWWRTTRRSAPAVTGEGKQDQAALRHTEEVTEHSITTAVVLIPNVVVFL